VCITVTYCCKVFYTLIHDTFKVDSYDIYNVCINYYHANQIRDNSKRVSIFQDVHSIVQSSFKLVDKEIEISENYEEFSLEALKIHDSNITIAKGQEYFRKYSIFNLIIMLVYSICLTNERKTRNIRKILYVSHIYKFMCL
jgi:hypothetical protein